MAGMVGEWQLREAARMANACKPSVALMPDDQGGAKGH